MKTKVNIKTTVGTLNKTPRRKKEILDAVKAEMVKEQPPLAIPVLPVAVIEEPPAIPIEKVDWVKYIGVHHGYKSIVCKGVSLNFAGTITGCGLAQIRGVVSLCRKNDITEADLRAALAEHCQNAIGGVFATLGESYYRTCHDRMLELGFKQIAEYQNWTHGPDYTQRMYMIFV